MPSATSKVTRPMLAVFLFALFILYISALLVSLPISYDQTGKHTEVTADDRREQNARDDSVCERCDEEPLWVRIRDAGKSIHVLTSIFKGDYSDTRFGEILESIARTASLYPAVESVHVFAERIEDPKALIEPLLKQRNLSHLPENLIVINKVARQPTYADFFSYANRHLQDEIVVIINSDIHFDFRVVCIYLSGLLDSKVENGSSHLNALALTRWPARDCPMKSGGDPASTGRYALPRNICTTKWKAFGYNKRTMKLIPGYADSFDAFAFVSPVPTDIIQNTKHVQNRLGAENVVVFEMQQSHLQVTNPCWDIPIFHLHCSGERKESDESKHSYHSDSYIAKGRLGRVSGRTRLPQCNKEVAASLYSCFKANCLTRASKLSLISRN